MMSTLMAFALLMNLPVGNPVALAEQVDLPKRCESACECEPCGCMAFKCKVETKTPFAIQETPVQGGVSDDAVKAQ